MDSTGKLVMESILETKAATILHFKGPMGFVCAGGVVSLESSNGIGPIQLNLTN